MPNLNKVMLMGNLTRDPEIKYTPKGTAIANLGMAINRVWTTDQGEKREEVTFVDVELWSRLAELAEQYLKKGRPVYIEGRLQLDSWDDKTTGQKRSKMKVVGEVMQFLGDREAGGGGGPRSQGPDDEAPSRPAPQRRPPQAAPPPQRKPVDPDLDAPEEDDIPF